MRCASSDLLSWKNAAAFNWYVTTSAYKMHFRFRNGALDYSKADSTVILFGRHCLSCNYWCLYFRECSHTLNYDIYCGCVWVAYSWYESTKQQAWRYLIQCQIKSAFLVYCEPKFHYSYMHSLTVWQEKWPFSNIW